MVSNMFINFLINFKASDLPTVSKDGGGGDDLTFLCWLVVLWEAVKIPTQPTQRPLVVPRHTNLGVAISAPNNLNSDLNNTNTSEGIL